MALALGVVCILCVAACVLVSVAYGREVRRVARFLRESPPESNERLNVEAHLPGCTDLVEAVDGRLEAARMTEREQRQEARRFQQELTALSHDVRTPLAGAKGYLQLAAEADDPAERQECLAAAGQRLDVMQGLLDSLFAYTHSLDGETLGDAEEMDVRAVLESVLAGVHPLLEVRGIAVDVRLSAGPLMVLADEEALRRVLENVVRNAAEHGTGYLRVALEGAELTFANGLPTGVQMDVDRVFERFYQADFARGCGNAGLGLTTVRNLCDGMGIVVEADVADGEFRLRMEFQRPKVPDR